MYILDRKERTRLSRHLDEILHEIVLRLEAARGDVLHQHFKPAFNFAGENADPEFARKVEIDGFSVEHGNAARHVKPADDDRDAGLAKWPRDVERPRVLVALHADQPDEAEAAGFSKAADQFRNFDARIGLVDGVDFDVDVRAKHSALRAVERDAVEGGKRVRRQQPAPPPDDISVVVIMGRFDEHDMEAAIRHRTLSPLCRV